LKILDFYHGLLAEKEPEPAVGHLELSVNKYRFNSARPELVAKIEYQHARLTELSEKEAEAKWAEAAAAGVKDTEGPPDSQWKLAMTAKSALTAMQMRKPRKRKRHPDIKVTT